jgi:hypothetical protein
MPTTADTASQGPGLQDAAAAFTGLLDREDGTPASPEAADPSDAPEQSDGDANAEAQPEETTETGDEPALDAESEEAADTSDETQAEPQKATPLYTVKVNGKDEQVTLEEALKGYSRTRDYTQKTDALATDRTVLAQERTEILRERQQYATLLTALQQQLQQGMQQEPNWEALYQQDPLQWAKARDDWRTMQEKAAAADFELQRIAQVQSQEQARVREAQNIEGRKKMLEMEPAWRNPKQWEADRNRIIEYGQKAGYSTEEIANANDPRAIVILNKARQWDELQANKPKPTAQRTGPQVASAGSAPVANNQHLRARQRLAQTGSVNDAAKVFMGLIE